MIAEPHSLYDFGPLAKEYDRWYETPAGRSHDRCQKAFVRDFLPPAESGERLLDVGCGTGHWSRFFVSCGFDVVGIDVAPEMVETAQRRSTPRCRFQVADACRLPFDNASFDVITAMAALEFVTDRASALAEMFRCVTPRGSIIVGTLNRSAPLNQRRVAQGKEPYASAHLFSAQELREVLERCGRVRIGVSAEATAHKPFGCASPPWRPAVYGPKPPQGAFIVAEAQL